MNVYAYQAALLCEDCGKAAIENLKGHAALPSYESDEWPQGPYADGGGEADNPQHCDHCNIFLENPLTSDGETYVREAVASGKGFCAGQWRQFYNYLFD
jgi:hypothetical protein